MLNRLQVSIKHVKIDRFSRPIKGVSVLVPWMQLSTLQGPVESAEGIGLVEALRIFSAVGTRRIQVGWGTYPRSERLSKLWLLKLFIFFTILNSQVVPVISWIPLPMCSLFYGLLLLLPFSCCTVPHFPELLNFLLAMAETIAVFGLDLHGSIY